MAWTKRSSILVHQFPSSTLFFLFNFRIVFSGWAFRTWTGWVLVFPLFAYFPLRIESTFAVDGFRFGIKPLHRKDVDFVNLNPKTRGRRSSLIFFSLYSFLSLISKTSHSFG